MTLYTGGSGRFVASAAAPIAAQAAARGKTNKVIASELGLSEHTVKNYLFRAFDKLGVSNRVELLFYLTSRGQTAEPTRADTGDGEPVEKS
jgi:predicted transcriptional regulator